MRRLTGDEARALALNAQGLGTMAPVGLLEALSKVQVVQLDAVNVVARSHYLVPFARLGHYDRAELDALATSGQLFEYWGHMASLLPADLQPLFRWRMEQGDGGRNWEQFEAWGRQMTSTVEAVFERVASEGPKTARDLQRGSPGRRSSGWSGGTDVKTALEYLFWKGRLTATRSHDFQRIYDLPERVLPPRILGAPTPSRDEAERELILRAADALGVATAADLRDYFALDRQQASRTVGELVSDGRLEHVEVEGWTDDAFVVADAATTPANVAHPGALVSPFDSLVFTRDRVERVFGFHYRLEMYVPAARRQFGYYVLPFLLGDRLVARVDLKADRKVGALLVRGVWFEDGVDRDQAGAALGRRIEGLAAWLGLDDVIDAASVGDAPPARQSGQMRLL